MAEVVISIIGFFYTADLQPIASPQHRCVGKNPICTCYLYELCQAVMWYSLTRLQEAKMPAGNN